MVEHLPTLTRDEALSVSVASTYLIAAAVTSTSHVLALRNKAAESNPTRRMRDFVEQNLHDADLTPSRICSALNISRSTLYRLCEPLGGAARFVLERRLARSHQVLTSATNRIFLARLAEEVGFKSASQFSRAFRSHFGYTPHEAITIGGKVSGSLVLAPNFYSWISAVTH
jgi:AraC-like DNA-binding protein